MRHPRQRQLNELLRRLVQKRREVGLSEEDWDASISDLLKARFDGDSPTSEIPPARLIATLRSSASGSVQNAQAARLQFNTVGTAAIAVLAAAAVFAGLYWVDSLRSEPEPVRSPSAILDRSP